MEGNATEENMNNPKTTTNTNRLVDTDGKPGSRNTQNYHQMDPGPDGSVEGGAEVWHYGVW